MICWYWRLDTALESGADEGRTLPLMSAITWDSQAGLGQASSKEAAYCSLGGSEGSTHVASALRWKRK